MKFCVTICLIISINTFGQNQSSPDSILQVLQTSKIDSVKIKSLISLAIYYNKSDPAQAIKYANEGIALANKTGEFGRNSELYLRLGTAYRLLGKNDSAIIFLKESFAIAKKYKNIDTQVKSLNSIGNIYTINGNYKEAAENLFTALNIAEQEKNTGLSALVYNLICALYYEQSNYPKALEYGEKALAILKTKPNLESLGGAYLNVGLLYADTNNEAKAKEYYELALKALEKTNAKITIATVYGNLSLLNSNSINIRLKYLIDGQKIWDAVAPDHPHAVGNLGNLGTAYLDAIKDSNFNILKEGEGIIKKKSFLLSKAETLLTTARNKCKELNFTKDLHLFTGKLVEVEELKGNYKVANQYLNEYIALNDSLFSQENKNKIAAVEGEREVAIRDKEIQLNKLAISAQKKVRIGLIAGLLLLAIIGGMFYWQSRTRRRTNTTLLTLNNELDEANKVKARFFGIISHDLRSPVANLISFLNVQQEEPEIFSKEKAAEHRAAITASAESLLETMEAMLQWSKSQMGNFKPQLKQTSIDLLFQNIQANFAAGESYNIRFSNPRNLVVKTDEDYLKTIVHNLTANAVKALKHQSGGLIEWKAYEENGKVILSITDNGSGANEQQIEALYNKEAAVNSKNGLGLHLIRDLARAIHCVISFSSKPGIGTTFQLALS